MTEQNIAISVENINKSFNDRNVLTNVTLDVFRGETFVIMGGSGSGKSTLLRIMTGSIIPDLGKIYFANRRYG